MNIRKQKKNSCSYTKLLQICSSYQLWLHLDIGYSIH